MCLDKDKISDNLIAEAKLKVGEICYKEKKKRWLTLYTSGRPTGDLLVKAKFDNVEEYSSHPRK
jgi:hypothetical protein